MAMGAVLTGAMKQRRGGPERIGAVLPSGRKPMEPDRDGLATFPV